MKNIVLYNGVAIPTIGLGTWLTSNDVVYNVVKDALEVGYTHFDSAQDYGNEENLGKIIKDSGIDRERLFITSKVASHHKSYESAKQSIEESFAKLQTPYIDLMLIHCPQPWSVYPNGGKYYKENIAVWKAMSEYYQAGKFKAIGVSNFSIKDLKNLMRHCHIKPMVNQIPVSIGTTNLKLIEFCLKNEIAVEAYSPIAHGRLLHYKLIQDMASKYGVSAAELSIAYTLQLGLISLPKTLNKNHMKLNLLTNFEITSEDMAMLLSLKEEDLKE